MPEIVVHLAAGRSVDHKQALMKDNTDAVGKNLGVAPERVYDHRCFDSHTGHFSVAIRELLAANEAIETFGMTFLPFEQSPVQRLKADIEQKIIRPSGKAAANTIARWKHQRMVCLSNFDVAISVTGAG